MSIKNIARIKKVYLARRTCLSMTRPGVTGSSSDCPLVPKTDTDLIGYSRSAALLEALMAGINQPID